MLIICVCAEKFDIFMREIYNKCVNSSGEIAVLKSEIKRLKRSVFRSIYNRKITKMLLEIKKHNT